MLFKFFVVFEIYKVKDGLYLTPKIPYYEHITHNYLCSNIYCYDKHFFFDNWQQNVNGLKDIWFLLLAPLNP